MPTTRQLPGIVFRVETPSVADLPRMDITAFVGFAARGPLHTPVPLTSAADFEDIFGGIYRLAWDSDANLWQTACLAPAVTAFFAQGGRRCWVVRVAGPQAATNQFPLAGLLRAEAGGYHAVTAAARSAGSWSDGLQAGAALQLDPLNATATAVRPGLPFSLDISPLRGRPVRPGDLLQLDCTDGCHRAYIALDAADVRPRQLAAFTTADPRRTHWFRRVASAATGKIAGAAQTVAPATPATDAGASLAVSTLTLTTSLTAAPGDWLRFATGGERAWLRVAGEARAGELRLADAWFEDAQPGGAALSIARLVRVQLALQVRQEPVTYAALSDLGCAAPHPRFAGALPADAALFRSTAGQLSGDPDNPAAALWDEVKHPRFPLSLMLPPDAALLPLGLEAAPFWRGALPVAGEPLVRDGLVPPTADPYTLTGADWASFIPDLFIDPNLRATGQSALLAEASDRLYLQAERLTGLHALLPVEEVSLLALPDAAQRGWRLTERQTVSIEPPPEPPPPPDPCAPVGPFEPCPAEDGAVSPAASGAEALPAAAEISPWNLVTEPEFEPAGLLSIQTAAAKLAAARGDMVAVLGLPQHYRTPAALQHQQQLNTQLRLAGDTTDSYAALYHPWLLSRAESGDLLRTDPTGGVCGVMATRSIERGAWVAPANVTLRDALAARPAPDPSEESAWYQVGLNLIRPGARGLVIWGSATQSSDPDLSALNVRRLLILLRRIALTEGQNYVFAPHSPAFRRRVQQQFEQRLAALFARGAFAGADPTDAYRVVIDQTINTPASIEQGQLVVELRVAPSQPITFITVRLVQLESGLLAIQELTSNGG